MNRRIYAAAVAAVTGAGMLTAALLQAAVATAAPGEDAFTIDGFTFDPMTLDDGEGFNPVDALNTSPPLLTLGGGIVTLFGQSLNTAPQSFDVYSGSGSSATGLGSINTGVVAANLLGLPNTEFTVTEVTPVSGVDASELPAVGTVYDVLNLGNGTYNVYTATPGADGTVTDTLVTPFGNVNLDSLFAGVNAANPLQPGDAFAGLQGDSVIGDEAFTIGNITFDPMTAAGSEGFDPVSPLVGVPPLLSLGGGTIFGDAGGESPLTGFLSLAPQAFDVYTGTGSSATLIGSITTGEDVTSLFGLTNTQFTVDTVTPEAGNTAAQTAALPVGGTVYDVFNLGNGYQNIYVATPTIGDTSGTVTDTFVTPFGNMDLSALFGGINAADALDPGAAFTGLLADDSDLGDNAFTLGGFIFDPSTNSSPATDGFNPIHSLLGAAPFLNIGGGSVSFGGSSLPIDTQNFTVYDNSGTEVATITSNLNNVSNLFGLANTEFTVATVTPATGEADANLPTVGTVYDVFNLGNGWENIYIATPGADGTVIDTFVTPFGNIDLSALFDSFNAANPLDPGEAFAGLDGLAAAVSAMDPLAFLGF
ncbi:hypothetical protein [Mycobacterium shimoidei]|uniref:hypothetical protein n=1 Tax=Mycobacterium shimoidei TaxID=29313 RepID=UPI00084946F6|nr:hypothetical protein [Mycobacterium shimoidei]MCV7257639.1 hypothetical protein [Mycobacterium shimoidei]ODR13451.1 hypothetical protein BHQ16_10505 [Mycobacterium shimoidei]ORW81599.1 hypothetical protein AWC26_08170 [Mycobacterium shimoidei]